MIKKLENGFKLLGSIDGIDSFLFDSTKADISINFIREKEIKRIMLNPFQGFIASDIKSILPLSNLIEELIIGSEKINYEGLSKFNKLTLLGVPDNGKNVVDLTAFPNLVTLNCSISNRLKGLENCKKLKKLTISNYKPKNKSLEELHILQNLEHLSLIKTDIITVNGIEHLSNLKTLEIFSASKLETLAPLQALSNNLKEIQVEQCKKINDFEILGEIQSLKKIILLESGEIRTLSFIKKLSRLEFISFFGTNVLDGNIKYCEGINYVAFDNKKHYTHKMQMFKNKE